MVVLVTNSNVKHEIDAGEYASRRAQCEAAAKIMGLKSLRDATDKHLIGIPVYQLIESGERSEIRGHLANKVLTISLILVDKTSYQ